MTNDDNDNDSSNVNKTIKKNFFFFTKKLYKHEVVLYIEVIRPVLNILFFLRKEFTHTKNTKNIKKHKNTHKQTEKAAFLCA